MSKLTSILAATSLLGLAACASPYSDAQLAPPAISAGDPAATLVVHRITSFVGMADGMSLLLDGVPAANLPSNGATRQLAIPARPLTVGLECGGMPGSTADLMLDARPGYTYRVEAGASLAQACAVHLDRIIPPAG